jgi:putative ABC transport system substrate-binding protein
MASHIGRRKFLATLLSGAAATWPLAARAQQPAMPVIGVLHSASPEMSADRLPLFRQGLKEAGYVEGENVAIEYRWAENQFGRLPALANDLIRRRVAVLAALGSNLSAIAAKEAAPTIPVVFIVSEDPVRLGLVSSIARPGGNLTGINVLNAELAAKRLDLLHEFVPAAVRVAALVNPANVTTTETTLRDLESAAQSIGLQIQVVRARTSREITSIQRMQGAPRSHCKTWNLPLARWAYKCRFSTPTQRMRSMPRSKRLAATPPMLCLLPQPLS